jgi:hypothetical protein
MEDTSGKLANAFSRGGFGWLPIDYLIGTWFKQDSKDRMVLGLSIIYSGILTGTMKE